MTKLRSINSTSEKNNHIPGESGEIGLIDLDRDVKDPKYAKKSSWELMEIYVSDHYDLRYNNVSNELEGRRKLETSSGKPEEHYSIINENNIYRDLKNEGVNISLNNLVALIRSGFVPEYDPFLEHFQSLPKWSKEKDPDYIMDFANYVKAKEPDLFNHHFKKMLVRTVACALDKSYYNKTAFVIISEEQNTGKTYFIRHLCPPALKNYICESFNFQDKDSQISLTNNFIFNIDELAQMKKVEMDALKAFFSKDVVKVRHPYDRKPKTSVRRASFFGSTNNTEFLSDPTGSVRWICFEIESIDWRGYSQNIDINMVWAQAYALFQDTGFQKDLTHDEIFENEYRNRSFQLSSPEIELIPKYYEPGTSENHDEFVTATDIRDKIHLDRPYLSRSITHITIGKALKLLGFKRDQNFRGGSDYRVKGYYVKTVQPTIDENQF